LKDDPLKGSDRISGAPQLLQQLRLDQGCPPCQEFVIQAFSQFQEIVRVVKRVVCPALLGKQLNSRESRISMRIQGLVVFDLNGVVNAVEQFTTILRSVLSESDACEAV
jgi:hypothetical protein